jgi:cytochrome c-type biogenesis protein CcmH/NrfG
VLRERVAETKAAPALHAFGAGQLLIGDSPGAIDTLRRAVQLAPDDPAVNADLAAALAVVALQNGRRQDTDGALAALDVAIALDPKLPEAWFNKALLLESDRRPAEAAAAWEVFLSLDSTSAWAEYARARRAKLGHRELP